MNEPKFILQCRTRGNSWEDSSEWDNAESAISALDEIRGENKRLGVSEFTSQFRVVQRVEMPMNQLGTNE